MNTGSQSGQLLPSLTVVIANYNHGHLIGEQLEAIFSQSVQPTKVIIIDDASTDDSLAVIRRICSGRNSVEIICNEKNLGVLTIVEKVLKQIHTDCVMFAAADDIILPGLFEKSLALLAQYPQAAFCSAVSLVHHISGEYVLPDATCHPSAGATFLPPSRVREALSKSGGWFMGNTTIFRCRPLVEVGGFPTELGSYSDGFISHVLALKHGACFIPEPLAIWRRFDDGYASSTARNDKEMERILLKSNARVKSDFENLFPREAIARHNARFLFRIALLKLDNLQSSIEALVREARPVKGGAIAISILRAANIILRYLLFLALRFQDFPRSAWIRIRRFIPGFSRGNRK